MEIYLDNAATTQVLEPVKAVMSKAFSVEYGNPSSKHKKGLSAERIVTAARRNIALTLKCEEKEIIFTSGGTESNNHALIGGAYANCRSGKHIITSRIEHASVLEPLSFLEERGFEVDYLPVDGHGHIQPDRLLEAVREDTILISLMHVNNEIGSIQPLEQLIGEAKKKKSDILVHVDAIQSYGKMQIVPKRMGIDLLSVSGHKIHGPKGVGFLYVKDKTKLSPIIFGGGQQRGMRSGTENVAGIAGLSEAASYMYGNLSAHREKMYGLKQYFIDLLQKELEGVTINGMEGLALTDTAPHIVSVGFEGVKSEVLLHALAEEGVYVSSGSACSSHHPELSGTLKAIGVEGDMLDSALRFSFSTLTKKEELDTAVALLKEKLPLLRKYYKR